MNRNILLQIQLKKDILYKPIHLFSAPEFVSFDLFFKTWTVVVILSHILRLMEKCFNPWCMYHVEHKNSDTKTQMLKSRINLNTNLNLSHEKKLKR